MNYAVILAGGAGNRFWPASTEAQPKQFLKVFSRRSLLEETALRISGLTGSRNIYIAANRAHRRQIISHANKAGVLTENLFFEPQGRNTFAPIAALAKIIFSQDKEAVIAVLPADHSIKENNKFVRALEDAFLAARKGKIIVLGVPADYPETGYGYVKIRSPGHSFDSAQDRQVTPSTSLRAGRSPVYSVEKFIEKPDLPTARELIKDKRYYWNAGIFIFKAQVLLDQIKRLQPKAFKALMRSRDRHSLDKHWNDFPSLSIDYAIMEKTNKLALIPLDCRWLDLGSWGVMEKIFKKDRHGNISRGRHMDSGSNNITVWSPGVSVVTAGLKDLIIVNTRSGLLVCAKDRTQEVKSLVLALKKKKTP
ncbi:MAG: sugar phosphate nucleotidyltransferase [Candidatus Omnitrophica bacterium]|nr:sugar phosphate nucleotidyltransferase [Candidatus Omnitrophota bacterium]